jgi:hypothetical protein
MFPEPANFAVTPLPDNNVIPVIDATPTRIPDTNETGRTIFQFYAVLEMLEHLRTDLTQYTHSIFAFQLLRGMHETIGKLPIGRQQQQAGGIEVKAPHGNPATPLEGGKILKDRGSTRRIGPGRELTDRLVIEQHATHRPYSSLIEPHRPAVNLNAVTDANPYTQFGWPAIDSDPSLTNPLFNFAPRTQPDTRQ